MKLRWAAGIAAIAMLIAGCDSPVAGTARPAPNLKPRPLTGDSIKRVLLDDVALAKMLNQPFAARKPLDFGGPDKLYNPDDQPSPADCVGVTTMSRKSVYEAAAAPAQLQQVALESWWDNGEPAQVLNVMESVVTVPTFSDARAMFTKFADQWRKCNGGTNTEQSGPISTTNVISDVRVTDDVVAATNTATSVMPNMPPLEPTPQARALALRANCIVEVTVVFFGGRRPSDPGSAKVDSSAIDIAHAVLDKISAAS